LRTLAERYGYAEDDEAFAAGQNIAKGDYSIRNLKTIVEWKSARIAGLIEKNAPEDVAKALKFAANPRTSERSAIDTLCRLTGIGIPVASAILTMVYPTKYTVIDFRALEALGIKDGRGEDTIDYYLEYLNACRALARKHNVSLRTLDRALWQWSKERGGSGECG
jgi:hypothetical protein